MNGRPAEHPLHRAPGQQCEKCAATPAPVAMRLGRQSWWLPAFLGVRRHRLCVACANDLMRERGRGKR